MRTTRTLAASIAVLACASGLTACGGGDGEERGGSGDDSSRAETVELTLWHNATTGDGKEFWEQTVADFMAEHPDVTIEIQAIQNEDMDGKLQTALNSGDAPDIFMQRGGGKMAAMAAAGQLMDLTDLVTDETRAVIPEGAFLANEIDGKTYEIPTSVLPGGIWYSKDLFEQAGITETPTTIDELGEVVQQLKDAGIQPIALGAKDAWPAAHWYYFFALRECSPDALSEAAKNMTFDDECWLKAGEDLKTFAATEPFNEGFLTTPAQQGAGSSAGLLANHQAAMELMGAWDPGVIASLTPDEQPLPDLDWFPFPEVPGGDGLPGSILGGVDGFSCSAQTDRQACGEFLNYLVTTEVQVNSYRAFDSPPVNTEAQDAVEEPYLQNVLAAYQEAPYVSQWLDTIYGQNVGNALNVAVVDMLAGNTDPDGIVQAVNDAAARS